MDATLQRMEASQVGQKQGFCQEFLLNKRLSLILKTVDSG